MNFLIVEDEEQAAKRLIRTIEKIVPKAFFHGPVGSISDLVQWLDSHPKPDLAFVDIHLADGLIFEAWDRIEPDFPLVFTTAYDRYALKAFEYNSVDYLLKPITEEALRNTIDKLRDRRLMPVTQKLGPEWAEILNADYQKQYKQRFVSRVGERLYAINTSEVLYAHSEDKVTFLVDNSGKRYMIEPNLSELEAMLDPEEFFRLNRQYIARLSAVEKILRYSNSRIRIELQGCDDSDIVLSRDKSADFKKWMDR